MLEIKSLEQFNEKQRAFRKSVTKMVSNCFLMPGEVEELIRSGSLFVDEYPGWLFIVCDREDYSNFYYCTAESSDPAYVKEFLAKEKGREFYMDIVTRNGRGDTETPERLISAGVAERYKAYQRMQLPIKNIDFDSVKVNLAQGYNLHTDYCDHEALSALWKESLDEKSTPLPQKGELEQLCKEGKLFTVLSDEGELAAVIMLVTSSKQGLLQHLVVSSSHRRKGLAISVMNAAFVAAREMELTTVRLWVDKENYSAINLYDRLGFVNDGMVCDQLKTF